MKKILCTILICLMLPFACIAFTACDNKDYDLKTFFTTYKNFADDYLNLSLVDADSIYQTENASCKIDINYTLAPKLSALVEQASTPYHHLKYFYQQLLDNSLAPLYFYGETIAQSDKVSDKQTEQLFEALYTLEENYKDVDYYLGILTTSLKATNNDSINIPWLRKLFEKYEQTILSANNLSSIICDVYFNSIISTSNIDYSNKTHDALTDADLTSISISVRSRIYYYKSIYANVYNQMFVVDGDLADLLSVNSSTPPSYAPYDYISSITSLEADSIENLRDNKETIYNNAISLYNIQSNINAAYQSFVSACSKRSNSSSNNQTNISNYNSIITGFANGIVYDSYEIIKNLIKLLYI